MKLWKRKTKRLFALIMTAILFAGSVDYATLSVSAEEASEHPDVNLTDAENPDNDLMLLQEADSDEAIPEKEKDTETDISGENEDTPKAEDSEDNMPENEDFADQTSDGGEPQAGLPENPSSDTDKNDGKLTTPEANDSVKEAASPETDSNDAETASTEANDNDTETAPAETEDNDAEPTAPEADSNDAETDNNDLETISDDDALQDPADVNLLQSDMEAKESDEGVVTEFSEEFIDLGDTYTSAPGGISLFSLNDGTVDLKDGSYVNWIDRLDLPDYAVNFYNTLVEASDNDGKDDFLIEDCYFSTDTSTTIQYSNDNAHGILVTALPRSSEFSKDPEYLYVQKCIRAVYDAFDRDHPEVFWLNGKTSAQITCTTTTYPSGKKEYEYKFYFVLKSSGLDIHSQTYPNETSIKNAIQTRDANISRILSNIQNNSDNESRIRALNDWLTKNNEYNTDLDQARKDYPDAWECVSALEGRTGTKGPVCEAYARAFKILCDQLNIPCVLVDGNAKNRPSGSSGAHMWNYVKLNGNWYAVDVTWNDPVVAGVSGAVSKHETDKWLLLCSNSLVADNWTFINSHPVENRVSVNGVEFINGPQLVTTADKNKKDISDAIVTLASADYIYNGKPHEPEVTVTLDEQTLTKDTDYIVSYEKNINAGIASVTVTAKGDNYKGKKTTTFQIGKANLSNAVITLNPASGYVYDKTAKEPDVTVTCNGQTLKRDTDYTISYHNNTNAGTATVTVTAKGNFEGTLAKNFTIEKAANTITLSETSYTYNASPSKEQTFSIKTSVVGGSVEYQSDNTDVTVNNSGVVTIPANYIGSAKITVSASGDNNYKAAESKYVTVDVLPIDNTITASNITVDTSDTAQSVSVGATYNGNGSVTYQSDNEHISVDRTGNITIAKNFIGTATITIHVAADGIYKDATKTIIVTVKTTINNSSTTISLKDIPSNGYIYNGKPYEPEAIVTWNGQTLEKGKDYTIVYQNNTNAGTATVIIQAIGDYQGEVSTTFQIGKADNTITVPNTTYTYNASPSSAQTFSIGAKATSGSVTYQSGNASVTVNASGTVTIPKNFAGTVTITINAPESTNYKAAAGKTVTLQVNPIANTITASDITKTASAAAQSFSIGAICNGSGKITYSSSSESVTVDSAGKVTIAKNFVGNATITINAAASGIYKEAAKTITITVNQAAGKITASDFTKTASTKTQSFSLGAKRNGSGKITYSSNNKSVKVNSKGKVTIAKNFVGKATITIKAAASGIYKAATKKITVTVNPANTSISSVKNSSSKKMTVTWKKSTAVTGYEIQYSTSKSFKTGVKKVTASKNSKVSTTVSRLTKGKTYYVRIRTYKTVSGKKYYSGWSKSKTVKITK